MVANTFKARILQIADYNPNFKSRGIRFGEPHNDWANLRGTEQECNEAFKGLKLGNLVEATVDGRELMFIATTSVPSKEPMKAIEIAAPKKAECVHDWRICGHREALFWYCTKCRKIERFED